MWTARNISKVIEDVQKEVNRLVTAASRQQASTDEKVAGLLEVGDDLIQSFCQLEENGNHIDSPCFRLGSGELKLHHHGDGGGGGNTGGHSRGEEKAAIRSVKRGKFITSYATCCNRDLSAGCRVCDRLPHESSESRRRATMQLSQHNGDVGGMQHGGEKEVHFVNVKERPPLEISNADEMAKILCMTRVGADLYKKFKERSSSMPTHLVLEISNAYSKGDVSTKTQDLQKQLENLNTFTKVKKDHWDAMNNIECGSRELIESRLDAFDLINNVKVAVHHADTKQGTDVELFDAIEELERHPDIPSTYTANTNRVTIGKGLEGLEKANFASMVALTRKRQRDVDDVTANFGYDMHNLHEDVAVKVVNDNGDTCVPTTVSDNCAITKKTRKHIEDQIKTKFEDLCTSLGVRGLGKRLRIDTSSSGRGVLLELHSYDLRS